MLSSPSAQAASAGRATNSWLSWERSIRHIMRISDPNIVARLAELGVEFQPSAALAGLTSLGIGRKTDLLRIKNYGSSPRFLRLIDRHHLPHQLLRCGSNLPVR